MPAINPTRLLGNLKTLRSFGATGTGVVRPSLSETDLASRHWLCEQLALAGLNATIDGIGTVLGESPNPEPAILIGSHTDTQPTGGWLDGALGVIYGLEVAQALYDDPATRDLPVCVASWIDEEGTFYGCLGSKTFCGQLAAGAADQSTDASGKTLAEVLAHRGLAGRTLHAVSARRYRGYIEAHIEQGPSLEASGKRIGVVSEIVGSRNLTITFSGKQNHAGTTPMALRQDAAQAMFRFAAMVNAAFESEAGDRTVWTTGRVELEPNAPSIIPGVARVNFQFRDPDNSLLDALQRTATDCAERCASDGMRVDVTPRADEAHGVTLDKDLRSHLSAAASQIAPDHWVTMPSGAVHDAQVLASVMPSAMLFIPSIGGVSHAFDEDTDEADIVLGCEVLLDATLRCFGQQATGGVLN